MANNIDKEYEEYLKQQEDAEYEAYKAQQAAPEKRDYLAETVMSPEFADPGMISVDTATKGLVGAANVADVFGSAARSGFSEATKGDYLPPLLPTSMKDLAIGPKTVGRFAKGAGEQLIKNIKSPFSAPMEAPSMGEIYGRELRTKTLPNLLTSEDQKRQAETVGGFLSELAMPAFEAQAISKIPKVKKSLESFFSTSKQALKSVERKQLQNVLDKYVTPTQLGTEGFDTEDISSVLVSNELSKYAHDPEKMLEALEGKKVKKRVDIAEGLEETEIVSETPGLIKAKSDSMRDEIVQLADENKVEVQVPAFAVKQKLIQENALMDPLSGQRYSPDIVAEREKVINELLKPYEEEWVPGVPLEAARPNFSLEVPPPFMTQPDMFPPNWQGQFERGVTPPELPPRPQFEGIQIPEPLKAPEDINQMAGVPSTPSRYKVVRKTEPRPTPPSNYGGIVSDDVVKKYNKDLKEWEKRDALAEKEYQEALKAADKADQQTLGGAEKIRQSLEKEAYGKYEDVKKAWEEESNRIMQKYQDELKKARGLDKQMMDTYIKHSADRFIEKAKKNKIYKQEIMDSHENYREYLIDALNRKMFNKPRYWSLRDMLELRTNLGKRMASRDFNTDKVLPVEKEVVIGLYRSLRNEITSVIDKIPSKIKGPDGNPISAAKYYDLQSDALSKMMQAKEILTNAKNKGLKEPDLTAKIIAGLTGGAIFGATTMANVVSGGNASLPTTALALTGAAAGYGASKAATPGMLAKGASMARSGLDIASKYPEELSRVLGTGSRQMRDNYVMENENKFPKTFGRYPQSVDIINTRIPRSIDWMLQNKEIVLEKLASTGMSDELYRAVAYGLNKSPKNLPNVVPLLMQEYDIFEDGPGNYQTLDGKFIDRNEAAKAADDVSNRENLNSIQRAKMINSINKMKVPEGL